MRIQVIGLFAVFAGMTTSAHAIGRWMGDNLTNNNPPAQNFALPAGIRNSVVRVETNYVVDQVGTSLFASGVVIAAHRDQVDGRPGKTGMLCVLTADHDTAFPAGVREGIFNTRAIVFNDRARGERGILVGRNMTVRGPGNNDLRVDIALLGVPIRDWDRQVPAELTPAAIMEPVVDGEIVLSGFGRTASIDTARRRMNILGGDNDPRPGTYRAGTNIIDAIDANHTVAAGARLGAQRWRFDAIRSDMDFIGAAGRETGADAHMLNADSGGPTFQLIDRTWGLVGSHSESEEAMGGLITEGNRQWDVRLWNHRAWIRENCANLVPEPSSFAVLGLLFGGLAARKRRKLTGPNFG